MSTTANVHESNLDERPCAKFDEVGNAVLITSGGVAIILEVITLMLLHRRPGRRADHKLIKGYAVAGILSASGRLLLGTRRRLLRDMKETRVKPVHCALQFNFLVSTIGNGCNFVLLLLLSLERLLYFRNSHWHKKLFTNKGTNALICSSALPSIINYLISYAIASYNDTKLISNMCYRLDIVNSAYYRIHVLWCTVLSLCTLISYACSHWRFTEQNSKFEGLQRLRRSRERAILNSLTLIFVAVISMELFPWVTFLFSTLEIRHQRILRVAYILDLTFLPVTLLLFLIIHPDLSVQLRACFKCSSCFKCCQRRQKVSTVYAG